MVSKRTYFYFFSTIPGITYFFHHSGLRYVSSKTSYYSQCNLILGKGRFLLEFPAIVNAVYFLLESIVYYEAVNSFSNCLRGSLTN